MGALDELRELARTLETRVDEGPDKLVPLSEAISRSIRPGMSIHIAMMLSRAMAATFELVRQYRGQYPEFTLIVAGFNSILAGGALLRAGLLKRVITSYHAANYPSPAPSRVYQAAFREGGLKIENWSLLAFSLRLKAAAMGLPFAVTKSMIGSTMAEETADFQMIPDPFNPGKRIGAVNALRPDISLIHGLAADRAGNTLIPPPWNENLWGALAAREGAIVTVERIVSTDFIRRHSHIARIPAHMVLSVSEVPFGAHPSPMNNHGVPGIDGYPEDYEFLKEARAADRPSEIDAWMEKWIYSVKDHGEYLRKLGFERQLFLRGKAQPDSYKIELESVLERVAEDKPHNANEHMVAVSSRLIADAIKRKGYRTMLAGIGASNLAAWLARVSLNGLGVEVELMAEIGLFGYTPRPADPFLFNVRNYYTSKALLDAEHVLGIHLGGEASSSIGSLGAGQIDRFGNINTTFIPPDTLLVGSGGGNDAASGCREVVVTVAQSRSRFLEKVPYITSPGRAVTTLVSNLGVYEKLGDDPDFTLTGYLEQPDVPEREAVQEIREQCGWELKIAPRLRVHKPPTLEELRLMRLFDPHGQFLGD